MPTTDAATAATTSPATTSPATGTTGPTATPAATTDGVATNAATTSPATTTTVPPAPARRRPLRRLHIELRKSVDTVSGAVLTLVTLVSAPLLVVLWTAMEGTEGMTIDLVVGAGSLAAALLLPVLTATLITAERGQGTIVTTLALDHARLRVLGAKVLAGQLLALAVAAACIGVSLLTALVTGIDLGDAGGVLRTCAGVTAALLIYALLGSAWGALTLSTPLAIGAAVVGPQVVNSLVTLLGERLSDVGPWLQYSYVVGDLTQGAVASWPRLGVVLTVWVVVPMLLGARRVARADIS